MRPQKGETPSRGTTRAIAVSTAAPKAIEAVSQTVRRSASVEPRPTRSTNCGVCRESPTISSDRPSSPATVSARTWAL